MKSTNDPYLEALLTLPALEEPRVSPDGRWVVFTSYRDGKAEIYLIPASDGRMVNLTDTPQSNESAPAWSR